MDEEDTDDLYESFEESHQESNIEQEQEPVQPIRDNNLHDEEWLNDTTKNIMNGQYVEEKYYQALMQLGERSVKLKDHYFIATQDNEDVLNDLLFRYKKNEHSFYLHNMKALCNSATSFEILAEKREKILHRICLARNRSPGKSVPLLTTHKERVRSSKGSVIEKLLSRSSKKSTLELVKEFLRSEAVQHLPFSLHQEPREATEKFQAKLQAVCKPKSTVEQRKDSLTALILLSFATGSLRDFVVALRALQEHDTLDIQLGEHLNKIKHAPSYLSINSSHLIDSFQVLSPYWMRPISHVQVQPVVASDGSFLYIHNENGLAKIGTGYHGTTRGTIYCLNAGYRWKEKQRELVCINDTLIYTSTDMQDKLILIACSNLHEEEEITMDRSKEPKLSLNSNENYSPRLRVATDGRHLYTVTGSGTTPQYFVDTWELKEKHLHFTQRKELKLPSDSLSSVSDGATCCCCKSVSFNSKWHKCTVCSTIYFCPQCIRLHPIVHSLPEHKMASVDQIPPAPPPPPPHGTVVPQPKTDPVVETPTIIPSCLSSDSFSRSYFVSDGKHLTVVVPAKVAPNKLDNYLNRVFDLSTGRFVVDVNSESKSIGSLCFDRSNNIMWSVTGSSPFITVSVFREKESPPTIAQVSPDTTSTLLNWLQYISSVDASYLLDTKDISQPLHELCQFVLQMKTRYMKSASNQLNYGIAVLLRSLRLIVRACLKAGKEVSDATLQTIYELSIGLLQVPTEEGEISSIKLEACSLIVDQLEVLLKDRQLQFVVDMICSKNGLLSNDFIVRNHFMEEFSIRVEHHTTFGFTVDNSSVANILPSIIQAAAAPLKEIFEALPKGSQHSILPWQDTLFLRLLRLFQLDLCTKLHGACNTSVLNLAILYIGNLTCIYRSQLEELMCSHCNTLLRLIVERQQYLGFDWRSLVGSSLIGQFLVEFLMSMSFVVSTIPSTDMKRALQWMEELLLHLDQVNGIVYKSDSTEVAYLQDPYPSYEYATQVIVESGHPYTTSTQKDQLVTIAAASSLEIHFDKRCCTATSSDYLEILQNRESVLRFHGECIHWPQVILIPCNSVVFRFHSGGTDEQSSQVNRFGFRATVKGRLEVNGTDTPSLLEAERVCSVIVGKILARLIVGEPQPDDAHPSFRDYTVEEQFLRGHQVVNASLGTFLDDLIESRGSASKLHAMLLSMLRKKILIVPDSVYSLVDQTSRYVVAVLLKHNHLVSLAEHCAESPPDIIPTMLIDIWSLVYVTQIRPFIKSKVQQFQSADDAGHDIVGAYTMLCNQIIDTAQFALKLSNIDTTQLLSFIKSLIPSKVMERLTTWRLVSITDRILGINESTRLLSSVTLKSGKHAILRSTSIALCGTDTMHYLHGLHGCGEQLIHSIQQAYYSFSQLLLSFLTHHELDGHMARLAWGALAMKYEEKDEALVRDVVQSLPPLIKAPKLWSYGNRPSSVTALSPTIPYQVLLSECTACNGGSVRVLQQLPPFDRKMFSVSLWMYPQREEEDTTPWQTVLLKGTEEGNNKTRCPSLFFSPSDLSLAVCVSTPGNWNVVLRSNHELPFACWTHVCCVVSEKRVDLYLNGVHDASLTLTEAVVHNDYPLYIGKAPCSDKPGFLGFIENVVYCAGGPSLSSLVPPAPPSLPPNTTAVVECASLLQIHLCLRACLTWRDRPELQSVQDLCILLLFDEMQQHLKDKVTDKLITSLLLLNTLAGTRSGLRNLASCSTLFLPHLSNMPPIVQLLGMRLLRKVGVAKLADIELLLDRIADFYCSTSHGLSAPTKQATSVVRDTKGTHVLFVHKWEGLSPDNFARLIERNVTKDDIRLRADESVHSLAMAVAVEAQDCGKSALTVASKDECMLLGQKLARLGITVELTLAACSGGVNMDNQRTWKNGQVAFALAAECTMLLRTVWNTDTWREKLDQVLCGYLSTLGAFLQTAVTGSYLDPTFRRCVASLIVIGGFVEDFRSGGRISLGNNRQGVALHFGRYLTEGTIVLDDDPHTLLKRPFHALHAVEEIDPHELHVTPSVIEQFKLILTPKQDFPLRSSLPFLFAKLKSICLKAFSSQLSFSNFARLCAQEGMLLPLIELAVTNDIQARVQTPVLRELATAKRIYELEWLSLEEEEERKEKEPHAGIPSSVATHRGDVHHTLFLSDTTVEYVGPSNDVLFLCGNCTIPESKNDFYYEVHVEVVKPSPMDESSSSNPEENTEPEKKKKKVQSLISVGLAPSIVAFPNWSVGYAYISNGNKSSPTNLDAQASLLRIRCPYCKVEMTERELCYHVPKRHAGSVKQVVCPVCAASPFGNPNYVSHNFHSHLQERHTTKLPVDNCIPLQQPYGTSFDPSKDIIGCGCTAEGGIYFTLNGKYLGVAFANPHTMNLIPLVSLNGGTHTRVTFNFGQQPFVFDHTEATIRETMLNEQQEIQSKLKKEQEEQQKRLHDQRLAQREQRREQATVLQGFVGEHCSIPFCMLALEKSNYNLEAAAEWAMMNYETYKEDHPELFGLAQESTFPTEEQDVIMESDITAYKQGYAYSLSNEMETVQDIPAKELDIHQLQVSGVLSVSSHPVKGRNWIKAMDRTMGRVGVIKEIDVASSTVLLELHDDDTCLKSEYWYNVKSLHMPSGFCKRMFPEMRRFTKEMLSQLIAAATQTHLCSSALQLAPFSPHSLSEPTIFLHLLRVFSWNYFTSPLPPLLKTGNTTEKIAALVLESSSQSASLVTTLLHASFTLLKEASEFTSKHTEIIESKHPVGRVDESITRVTVPDSCALHINFDKRSFVSSVDSLQFFLDSECTTLVASVHADDASSAFAPIVIPSDCFFFRCKITKESSKNWGYKFTVVPSTSNFNLAVFTLEFLLKSGDKRVPGITQQIFRALFDHLYNTVGMPLALKVHLLNLLTRILQDGVILPLDIKSSDPHKMRDILQDELTELLNNAVKTELSSPYLQALTELMAEMQKSMQVDKFPAGYPRVMTLFDQVTELRKLADSFRKEETLPLNFLQEVWKNFKSHNMDEQSFVKLSEGHSDIMDLFHDALTEIYHRFDTDKDNFLNESELHTFMMACNKSLGTTTEYHAFLETLGEDKSKGLSVQGFIAWHKRDFEQDRVTVYKRLRYFGYDPCFRIQLNFILLIYLDMHNETYSTLDEAMAGCQWRHEMDEALVEFVNSIWDKTGFSSLLMGSRALCMSESDKRHHPLLLNVPLAALRFRFTVIKQLNLFVDNTLPLIDLNRVTDSKSIANQLSAIRHLIFYDVKVHFLRETLEKTTTTKDPITITLSRLDTMDGSGATSSVFMQAFKQLFPLDPSILRQRERAFKVIFKNEHAEGEVGPFRESITSMCTELQSTVLPLFIPCPNQQNNVGENRDKFVVNPSANGVHHLQQYYFMGMMMGIAIRAKNSLSLDLPAIVWKRVVRLPFSTADVRAVDINFAQSLDQLSKMNQEEFSASIFETFTTTRSDKSVVELKEGGSEINLQFADREEFIQLKWQARLNESSEQLEAMMKGLGAIVPDCVLSLFTWTNMNYLACGTPDVDIELLRRHTKYRGGLKTTDPHIVFFWHVLENFTPQERTLFLRFAWGRDRLPPECDFNEEMKIFPSTKSDQEKQLPHADTCFFNVSLPAYSTEALMREKLLKAITETRAMDADNALSDMQQEGFWVGRDNL